MGKSNRTNQEPIDKKQVAVALGYDQNAMNAPKVLATGKGFIADKIMATAVEHNIPIRQDQMLAEALGQLDLGEEIPSELYQVVAEVLAFIMEMNGKHVK